MRQHGMPCRRVPCNLCLLPQPGQSFFHAPDISGIIVNDRYHFPGAEGLGILKGKICRIPDAGRLKVPHIGWNDLRICRRGRLLAGIPENAYVYFVHSLQQNSLKPCQPLLSGSPGNPPQCGFRRLRSCLPAWTGTVPERAMTWN